MTTSRAKTIVPGAWAERVEDIFHIILGIVLLGIAAVALVFTMIRLFTTAPFFPTGMIQAINDVLFIIIILEINIYSCKVLHKYINGTSINFLLFPIVFCFRYW